MSEAIQAAPKANGSGDAEKVPNPMTEALASEEALADEAMAIWGDESALTPALFMKLWPLLKRSIPAAFIEHVGAVDGKPFETTGVRSVQVQIDRMNNVLTPLWWWYEDNYEDDGTLASVSVYVGTRECVLAHRSSRGGVRQAKPKSNSYKGSFTNAAKVAFARLGPGHEVYVGAADLDPDVNAKVAEAGREAPRTTATAPKGSQRPITPAQKGKLNALMGAAELTKAQASAIRVWWAMKHETAHFDRLPSEAGSDLIDTLGDDGVGAAPILTEIATQAERGHEGAQNLMKRMAADDA